MNLKQVKNPKHGYVICNACNGWGYNTADNWVHYDICNKCWGDGQLDWVEDITGRPQIIVEIEKGFTITLPPSPRKEG